MKRYAAFALMLCIVVSSGAVIADVNEPDPVPVGDMHTDPHSKFSHWSAVVRRTSFLSTIEYAVCNLHESIPLIYTWKGPNITVGPGGQLPVGKCHIANRDVADFQLDTATTIAFTQAGLAQPASAYLSKLPASAALLPRFLVNTVRAFYGPESAAANPSLADLRITQAQLDGRIRHTISWRPPTVTIAIDATALGSATEDVVGSARSAGYEATVMKLGEALSSASRDALPKERLSGTVVLLARTPKAADQLQFETEGHARTLVNSYISLINPETKNLITDVEIGAFSQ